MQCHIVKNTLLHIASFRKFAGWDYFSNILVQRMNEEREQRLQRLSSKISASQAAKLPERSTKLAYVAGAMQGGRMKKHSKEFSSIGEKRKELLGIIFFFCLVYVCVCVCH